jgi:hypothetical protein
LILPTCQVRKAIHTSELHSISVRDV